MASAVYHNYYAANQYRRQNLGVKEKDMTWAQKRDADIYAIRERHLVGAPRKEHASGTVETLSSFMVEIDGKRADVPAGSRGRLRAVRDDGISEVDFGGTLGTIEVPTKILTEAKQNDMRDVIRRSLMSEQTSAPSQAKTGSRMTDGTRQIFIELKGLFGSAAQAIDEQGHFLTVDTTKLRDLPETAPLAPTPNGYVFQEDTMPQPMGLGQKVKVAGLNRELNQHRTQPVYNGEDYTGRIGTIGFAFYPINSGVRMYRVFFDRGGARDFSEGELTTV